MNELAHWIMNVGTGAMIGISIISAGYLLARLAEALPNHIPVITPTWNAIRDTIRKPVDWIDQKTRH